MYRLISSKGTFQSNEQEVTLFPLIKFLSHKFKWSQLKQQNSTKIGGLFQNHNIFPLFLEKRAS